MKILKLTALALLLTVLCGCQAKQAPVPTEPAPTFGEPISFETVPEGETLPESQQAVLNDTFKSADGSVEFSFHIDQQLPTKNLRILEAALRPITGEDAKKLAEVVFPDCTFYDQEPQTSKLYSKEEVERNIELYTKYSDMALLTQLYGTGARDYSIHIAEYREIWKKRLKKAREENPHEICQWEFKPDMYYYDIDQRDANNYWNVIYSETQKGDVVYGLNVFHSSEPGSQVQKLDIGVSGQLLTHQLGWYTLCHGDEPTETQIEEAKKRAQDILDRLDVGRWQVTGGEVEYSSLAKGSYISVKAEMLLDNIQIPFATGIEDGWWLSSAYIGLTVDGEMVDFELVLPMELKGTVTDRPSLLSLDEILAQTKEKLTDTTASAQFGRNLFPLHIEEQKAGESLICKVDVSKLEYSMARMKAPDDADTFYFYPVLTFHGTADYYGQDSGTLHITTEECPLFSISALNGELTVY